MSLSEDHIGDAVGCWKARIGPLIYYGRESGPDFVDVIVMLRPAAVGDDLSKEGVQSEMRRYLVRKGMDLPKDECDRQAILAFLLAMSTATVCTAGSLELAPGLGGSDALNIQSVNMPLPARQADHMDERGSAWVV